MLVAVAKLVVLPYMTAKKDVILYKIYVKNYYFYTLFIYIAPFPAQHAMVDGKPSKHRRKTRRNAFIVRKNQNRKTKEALLHCKIIIKIYLSENKEVTLLTQLNR